MSKLLWSPSEERITQANITDFSHKVEEKFGDKVSSYHDLYQWSIDQSEKFWSFFWQYSEIISSQPWTSVCERGDSFEGTRWFTGTKLNFAENLLRHGGNKIALVSYLENGTRQTISYDALRSEVGRLALALKGMGVNQGDRVAGLMPNVIETVVSMLATASLGAVWTSCSPDFGASAVVDRFAQVQPKVLLAADGYTYNGKIIHCLTQIEEISQQLPSLDRMIIVPIVNSNLQPRGSSRSILWDDALAGYTGPENIEFEQVPFDHPLYILYSSGTTGTPKSIVHSVGGTLIQHLKEHLLHVDLKSNDTWFYYTTCGWMMWNWMVSSLAIGSTLVLYDGSPFFPNHNALLRLIDEESITVFGTSAKYLTALEKVGSKPGQEFDLSTLKSILSTGSPLTHSGFDYVYNNIKRDVCLSSISGGTDIVSCFALGNPTLPVYRGQLQCRGLGMAVDIFDDSGRPVRQERGELVCTKPFPSVPIGFWGDDQGKRFKRAYFALFNNCWAQGDYGEITKEEGFVIYGRSDAVLNPGGVRIGTAEIYRQVEKVQWIVDSIAVGQIWQSDVRVVLFVVLQQGEELDEERKAIIRMTIRNNTTPRHVPTKIIAVSDLPRTLNGKNMELAVRSVIHGETVSNKYALVNPEVLDEFVGIPELSED